MEGEEGGSLNTNNLLPPVQILDPEAEMDQLPTGLYSYYFLSLFLISIFV